MIKRKDFSSIEMKNGVKVSSIEELRQNADIESIMNHYLTGQLSEWCRKNTDIDLDFDNNNIRFVKSVMDILDVGISDDEIQEYTDKKFGSGKCTCQNDILDEEIIKNKLDEYKSITADIEDYSFSSAPVKDENDRVTEYEVIVECRKTKQYTRFVLPYYINEEYTAETFKRDLSKKTAYAIKSLAEQNNFNSVRSVNYASLSTGDCFKFGLYNNKYIEWKVLKRTESSLYVIASEILCVKVFDSKAKDWPESELRKWLNGEFYNNAFSQQEKNKIGYSDSDKITLLNEEEFEEYQKFCTDIPDSDIEYEIDDNDTKYWWLKSGRPSKDYKTWKIAVDVAEECLISYLTTTLGNSFIPKNVDYQSLEKTENFGVRPSLYIDLH